jgi:hypothetical protein
LPCYWIYWEAGKAFLEEGSPNLLYQKWMTPTVVRSSALWSKPSLASPTTSTKISTPHRKPV